MNTSRCDETIKVRRVPTTIAPLLAVSAMDGLSKSDGVEMVEMDDGRVEPIYRVRHGELFPDGEVLRTDPDYIRACRAAYESAH